VPSAGDVERFAYCPHNWYLAHRGVQGAPGGGEAAHAALGEAQAEVETQKADYRHAMRWSFRILAASASVGFLALELVYLRAHPQHLLFLTTALVMVSASSGLMVIGLEAQRRYQRGQVTTGLAPGRLLDTDLAGTAELLHDKEWDLSGRPDYIIDGGHGPVPVEVKARRAPKEPFPSHVMQVATYLRLLEAQGREPPYGLVQYTDGFFRVEWDDAARGRLRTILDRMAAGETDRDHQHAARCKGCARRKQCEQRLA